MDLINKSIDKHKSSFDLWRFSLKLKIDQTNIDNEHELIELFNKSIGCVKQKVFSYQLN
jgi:hypothetical protein